MTQVSWEKGYNNWLHKVHLHYETENYQCYKENGAIIPQQLSQLLQILIFHSVDCGTCESKQKVRMSFELSKWKPNGKAHEEARVSLTTPIVRGAPWSIWLNALSIVAIKFGWTTRNGSVASGNRTTPSNIKEQHLIWKTLKRKREIQK